jgi:hypothetical protein
LVRVFELVGSAWVQQGADLSAGSNAKMGSLVRLSSDANTLLVLSDGDDTPYIYSYDSGLWSLTATGPDSVTPEGVGALSLDGVHVYSGIDFIDMYQLLTYTLS